MNAEYATAVRGRAPRFSILIPVWNGSTFLGGAIDSVLAQASVDLECVVSDNASDEDLAAVCAARPDDRLRYHRWTEHVEIFESFDRALGLCRGDWVFLLPADDRLLPGCLEGIAARIDAYTGSRGLAAVFPKAARVDAEGRPIDVRYHGVQGETVLRDGTYSARDWLIATAEPGSPPWDGGAFRRDLLDAMGVFFRTDIPSMSADLELAIRLAAHGDIEYIDEPLMAVTGSTGSHTPGRFRNNMASGEAFTTRGIAYSEGLRAHEAVRAVGADERAVVNAAIARTHLRRATAQRTSEGGRGRRGAVGDLAAAMRLSPGTVLRNLPLAVAQVLAPVSVLEGARERALRNRERATGPG